MIVKQQRARKHIDETARLIKGYFSEIPIRLSTKTSECGQWNITYIAAIAEYDSAIPCVIGDALFNLRSSLDHMMMMIVLKHCDPQKTKPEKVYFPIKKKEAEFKEWRRKDSHANQLPPSILNTLESFKPFKGGSMPLSTLHELNNIDKHRNLIVSAFNYKSINLLSALDKETFGDIARSKHGDRMAEIMSSLWINDENMLQEAKVGQEVTRYRVGKTPGDAKVKFEFSVIEANVEVRPVIELLNEIDREVASVNNALQSFL